LSELDLLRIVAEAVAAETGARRVRRLDRATRAAQIPGWDSLNHGRIVLALEERLGLAIDIAHTFELRDVGALVDYLAALRHDDA
jgi:acyl carrier protein